MCGFDIDWLTLRRPADRAARSSVVLGLLARDLGSRAGLRVVDLGAGSGSTLAAVSPVLGRGQSWHLVDIDGALLSAAAAAPEAAGVAVTTAVVDLARDLEAAIVPEADLVTCSALLDLVSAPFVERLARLLAARGLPFYAALTYDGRMEAHPPHPLDGPVREAFDRHQGGDKGFGPALGPDAHAFAASCFADEGFEVTTGPSDWVLGPAEAALQEALVLGHEAAVAETGALTIEDLALWRTARLQAIADGTSRLLVGHGDLYARPPGPS